MKLPRFLKRGNDDEDEDDEDFEDFEDFDEEEFDPDSAVGGGEGDDFDDVLDDGSTSGNVDDDPFEADTESGDTDVPDGLYGDDEDIDFGDDEDDDDDEEGSDSRKPVLFLVLGVVVLIGGIAGGAAFWMMGDESESTSTTTSSSDGKSVAIALPPRTSKKKPGLGGSLNSRVVNPESTTEATPASASSADSTKAPESDATAPKLATPAPAQATPGSTLVSSLGGGGLNARAGKVGGPRQGLIIPAATSASYRNIPDQVKAVPLAAAPDKELEQPIQGLEGPLPKIGKDGRKPWEVYSRPPNVTGSNPRVAILVKGLGFSRAVSMAAIKKLPGNISLSFSPYARDLNDWLVRARLGGHEVFLELPMESKKFPAEDAGPLGLNTNLQVADNMKRLHQVMSKMGGYVGLVSTMGSKYSEAEGQLKPILQEIKKRGLMFVDGTGAKSAAPRIAAEIELPKAFVNIVLDDPPDRQSLDRKLKSMESIVKKQAVAVAVIHAYPSTIERLIIWVRTMEDRQMTLVPLSAVADKQFFE